MSELSIAEKEMMEGNASIMLIRNTNSWLQNREKISYFSQIQRLYGACLPKMEKYYIAHTTFDSQHKNIFLRNTQSKFHFNFISLGLFR